MISATRNTQFFFVATAIACSASFADPIDTIFLDPAFLAESRARLEAGDAAMTDALSALRRQADQAMKAGPFSVMDKPFTPPSGDKHDYMSISIYWWPNSITKYPYVHKDGQRNPEADEYDGARIAPMCRAVETLALAYYFTKHEPYAARAALLLRTWFLDPATRMNPHMRYAQGIPGLMKGARQGIIESVPLATRVLDAVGLIDSSSAWTAADQAGLDAWFREFLDWLETSRLGKQERKRKNNHGTWFDVQTAAFALFTGQETVARTILESRTLDRIAAQIRPNGEQPEELRRTKSFDYSCYNLDAFFYVAAIGRRVGVDVWGFEGEDGQSVRTALQYLLQYVDRADEWPHKQIYDFDPRSRLAPFVYRAAIMFEDASCQKELDSGGRFERWNPKGRLLLLYPPPHSSRTSE